MSQLPASVTELPSELPSLAVCNRHARARIFLHGAHVASWRPVGQGEVLWMSVRSAFAAGKPIRGGVPICFPWFGPHAQNAALPVHGLVRLRPWSLRQANDLPDGRTKVVLGLDSSPETEAVWPHPFELSYSVVVGAELELELQVRNTGKADLVFEEALHTYFDVTDIRGVTVHGLDGASYLDKVDGGRQKVQSGSLAFDGETDRVYAGNTASCAIRDPGAGRRIDVHKQNSRTTVVWNPWIAKAARMADFGDDEWPGMVCVETANAATDRVTLAAGESHVMSARIAVAPAG